MLIKYSNKEIDLCARLMRAEALGEGELGMLMVGNVIVNRALANCLDFKNIRTITDVVYQNPGGFTGTNSQLFFSGANTKEKELALRVLKGEYYHPATNALWFYSPSKGSECKNTWFNQKNSGRGWIFAALNVLREIVAKKCDIKEFELSQSFVAFYDKL